MMKNTNLTADKLAHFLRDVERQCESNEKVEDRIRRIRNVIRSWRQQEWENVNQQASIDKLRQLGKEMSAYTVPPEEEDELEIVLKN